MLEIVNNKIYITRGDSAYLSVNIIKSDKSQYEMTAADQLIFSIKRANSPTVIARCEGEVASDTIRIPTSATKLNIGQYLYDIQLIHNFYADTEGNPLDPQEAIGDGVEPVDWDVCTLKSGELEITLEVGKRTNTTPINPNF